MIKSGLANLRAGSVKVGGIKPDDIEITKFLLSLNIIANTVIDFLMLITYKIISFDGFVLLLKFVYFIFELLHLSWPFNAIEIVPNLMLLIDVSTPGICILSI